METYYIRLLETDYPELISIADEIGLIKVDGQDIIPKRCSWDYIGYNIKNLDKIGEGRNVAPKYEDNAQGVKWIYVNVRTDVNVIKRAKKYLQDNPEDKKNVKRFIKYFEANLEDEAIVTNVPPTVYL